MLPYDILYAIFTYVWPLDIKLEYTNDFLRNLHDGLMVMNTLSKKFKNRRFLTYHLNDIRTLLRFVRTYHVYQEDYEWCTEKEREDPSWKQGPFSTGKFRVESPPFLYDAILSGCTLPFCKSSKTEVCLDDVVEMIRLCPSSVKYNMGWARCRNGVSPLWGVMNNSSTSISVRKQIRQLLLKNGASLDDYVYVNGNPVTIRNDR
jgi:hypothetical protein